jgi:hypothetical protein
VVGLKTELISGDRHYGDQVLNTFNPLFPNGGYFGLAALFGPLNLYDLHPSVSLALNERLDFAIDYDAFWRQSDQDGIYTIRGRIIYSGKNSSKLFIGQQFSTDLQYVPNRFLFLKGEFKWFHTGGFLKEVGTGKDIFFVCATMRIRF